MYCLHAPVGVIGRQFPIGITGEFPSERQSIFKVIGDRLRAGNTVARYALASGAHRTIRRVVFTGSGFLTIPFVSLRWLIPSDGAPKSFGA